MLDLPTRAAILKLSLEGHSQRFIAEAIGVSRDSVRAVLASGEATVPALRRPHPLDPHRERIIDLMRSCRGNRIRVHEELQVQGAQVSYQTLTRYCRQHGIGKKPAKRAGRYTFEPGEEMQHDTSPHKVTVGGRQVLLQCASLVLCFSRMRFMRCYPRYRRFQVRGFLTEALVAFEGAARRCMLDNSNVVIARGTGRDAVPAPEMQAFSKHFGFTFVAHRVGDANRSARVERPFDHVERNFYPGRTFADLDDLNAQLRAWCDRYNHSFRRHLKAIPADLYAAERAALLPLPAWVPEPVALHPRKVDVEGYINLHANRYSVPAALIGQRVEVHETPEHVRVYQGHELHSEHRIVQLGQGQRRTLEAHRHHATQRNSRRAPSAVERELRAVSPEMASLCDALRQRYGGQALHGMRRLKRLWMELPDDALHKAIERALAYGLDDLQRIERMALRNVRGDFFRLPNPENTDG